VAETSDLDTQLETLQRNLLPQALPEIPGAAVASRYVGAQAAVGGDWYDVFEVGQSRLGLMIGDVTGHGPAAATHMSELRVAARAYALEGHGPAEILRLLNTFALEIGVRATAFYVEYDIDAGIARYANAGHPPALIVRPGREPVALEGAAQPPLGVRYVRHRESGTVALSTGTLLLLYTDGLVEVPGEALSKGLERLGAALAEIPADATADDVCDAALSLLAGHEVKDDAALLAMTGPALTPDTMELTLTADGDAPRAARQLVRRWLDDRGADPDSRDRLVLAVSEAVGNAVEHAYGLAGGDVTITIDARGDRRARVVVRDSGSWREPRGDKEGRGLTLIRDAVDVEIERAGTGTTVTLTADIMEEAG
jgi:anti-sigma regulatory factor (Ser/Thr protein kinase)